MKKVIKKALVIILVIGMLYGIENICKGESYKTEIQMGSINIGIIENNQTIENDGKLEISGEVIKPGKTYEEDIRAINPYDTYGINEYVRINVYKYFTDDGGNKVQTADPSLIELEENIGEWIKDEEASTVERTVYYYKRFIEPGEETVPVIKSIRISPEIANWYNIIRESDGKGNYIIKTVPVYEGLSACVEIKVDAVQDHNAEDAIWSAWGREVNIAADGTLSLK